MSTQISEHREPRGDPYQGESSEKTEGQEAGTFADRLGFWTASEKMAQQLTARGLIEAGNFSLWNRLKLEQIENSIARSQAESYSQLSLLVPFVQQLPISDTIKRGIQRELAHSHLAHAERHPEVYHPKEIRFLEKTASAAPSDTVVTRYRSRGRLAQQVASIFEQLSLDRFLKEGEGPKGEKQEAGTSGGREGGTLERFWVVDGRLASMLEGPERILTRLYRDNHNYPGLVQLRPHLASSLSPHSLATAFDSLRALGGLVPDKRQAILARFGGEFPLVVHPQVQQKTDNGPLTKAEGFGMLFPYGSFSHNRTELERIQAQVEKGESSGCSLVIRGRIDRDFLAWLSGSDSKGHDPVPDVEVLYALPLPSGREHLFVLKSARSFTARNDQPPTDYPEEDRHILNCLGKYFLLPDHKKNVELLTEFRRADYPNDLHSHLSEPHLIEDISLYESLCDSWNASLLQQLREADHEYQETFSHLTADAVPLDTNSFHALWEARVDSLPEDRRYHEAEHFRLTPAEKQRFLQEYVPRAHAIFLAEFERASSEDEAVRTRRRELGYHGPLEGYHLPLDHMLMDMIIDLKKRDRYRERKAQETGQEAGTIEVPEEVGRSYEKSRRSFPVEELPQVLARLSQDKIFTRQSSLRVFDPMSQERYREHPPEATERVIRDLIVENCRRVEAFIALHRESHLLRVRTGVATDIEQTCVAILSRLTTTTLSRIKLHLANEFSLEEDRKAESAALHRDLTARGAPKAERSAIFTAQKERYAATAAKVQRELYADYAKLEFLWSTFAPTSYFELAQRGHSVSDARRIKFIYSIGHDGIPLLSPELPSRMRDRRETHSQQLSGRNMFAGGELVLAQHDQLFHSIGAWRGFDAWLKGQTEPLPWTARELNNSTGHYLVLSDTLAYASAILYPALEKVGIATNRCETVDRLLPGLRIRGAGLYRFT